MKNRFKFRVWDKENSNSLDFEGFKKGDIEFNFDIDTNSIWIEFNHNKYILEQSTGLKDKNGNLIYEGDIITYEWLESNGRCWKTDGKKIVKWNFGFVPIANIADYKIKNGTARNVQVIGNIYENKDLLERTTNE